MRANTKKPADSEIGGLFANEEIQKESNQFTKARKTPGTTTVPEPVMGMRGLQTIILVQPTIILRPVK